MDLLCVGLNHRTAPVEVRERFAVAPSKLGQAAMELREKIGAEESLVISTCNRTEFYVAGGSGVIEELMNLLGGASHCYTSQKREAALHLCRVVSGLDSVSYTHLTLPTKRIV